jgi:hypothetical protein
VQVRLPDTTVDVPVQVRGTPAPAPDNAVYVPVSAPQPVAVNIPVQIVGPTINGRYYRDSAGSCYDSFTQQPTTAANCATTTTASSCPAGFVSNGVNCVQVQTSQTATMSTRYVRDSRTNQCVDTLNFNQVAVSTLCGFRRSSHTAAESSQVVSRFRFICSPRLRRPRFAAPTLYASTR